MGMTRLSFLPAFAQQAEAASSAVVFSYTLLGKAPGGEGSQTIKKELDTFFIPSKISIGVFYLNAALQRCQLSHSLQNHR